MRREEVEKGKKVQEKKEKDIEKGKEVLELP